MALPSESLTNEITELGMSLIMGGTTDAFGAAKQELTLPSSLINEVVNEEDKDFIMSAVIRSCHDVSQHFNA